jgi:uncharacterized protein GlcG (DUF336 family)
MINVSKLLTGIVLAALPLTAAGAQGVITQKNLSLGLAQTIAGAALAKCESLGYRVSVTVVDREGVSLVLLHGDGAGLNTNEGSERKAFTAAAFRQPSAAFVQRMKDRPDTAGSIHYSHVLALGGGLPIKVGDDTIGAVGVSGSPGKDDVCAQAGIDKAADQLK